MHATSTNLVGMLETRLLYTLPSTFLTAREFFHFRRWQALSIQLCELLFFDFF
jgi:hypothetical protein